MASSQTYLRPGFVVRRILNPLLSSVGAAPTLTVRGRRSGKPRSVPIVVFRFEGQRYLVAPRGETNWARNLRAAREGEIRTGKKRERFRGIEIPVEEAGPILESYADMLKGPTAKMVRAQLAALPAEQHPVFRLEPLSAESDERSGATAS